MLATVILALISSQAIAEKCKGQKFRIAVNKVGTEMTIEMMDGKPVLIGELGQILIDEHETCQKVNKDNVEQSLGWRFKRR